VREGRLCTMHAMYNGQNAYGGEGN